MCSQWTVNSGWFAGHFGACWGPTSRGLPMGLATDWPALGRGAICSIPPTALETADRICGQNRENGGKVTEIGKKNNKNSRRTDAMQFMQPSHPDGGHGSLCPGLIRGQWRRGRVWTIRLRHSALADVALETGKPLMYSIKLQCLMKQ